MLLRVEVSYLRRVITCIMCVCSQSWPCCNPSQHKKLSLIHSGHVSHYKAFVLTISGHISRANIPHSGHISQAELCHTYRDMYHWFWYSAFCGAWYFSYGLCIVVRAKLGTLTGKFSEIARMPLRHFGARFLCRLQCRKFPLFPFAGVIHSGERIMLRRPITAWHSSQTYSTGTYYRLLELCTSHTRHHDTHTGFSAMSHTFATFLFALISKFPLRVLVRNLRHDTLTPSLASSSVCLQLCAILWKSLLNIRHHSPAPFVGDLCELVFPSANGALTFLRAFHALLLNVSRTLSPLCLNFYKLAYFPSLRFAV